MVLPLKCHISQWSGQKKGQTDRLYIETLAVSMLNIPSCVNSAWLCRAGIQQHDAIFYINKKQKDRRANEQGRVKLMEQKHYSLFLSCSSSSSVSRNIFLVSACSSFSCRCCKWSVYHLCGWQNHNNN